MVEGLWDPPESGPPPCYFLRNALKNNQTLATSGAWCQAYTLLST
jgi:hypothetical protein